MPAAVYRGEANTRLFSELVPPADNPSEPRLLGFTGSMLLMPVLSEHRPGRFSEDDAPLI